MGPGVAYWLRCCATSRKVPGSNSGDVTGFFSDIFPSDHTMHLGSTQLLVKMSTRNIPGCKGVRCVRLTTSPPSRAECHEIWEPKPPGTLWATPGLLRDCFNFYCHFSTICVPSSGLPNGPIIHSVFMYVCMCVCVCVCARAHVYTYMLISQLCIKEMYEYYGAEECMSVSLCGSSVRISKGKFTRVTSADGQHKIMN